MRLTAFFLFAFFLFSCSSDRNKTHNKVLQPERLNAILREAHDDRKGMHPETVSEKRIVIRSQVKTGKDDHATEVTKGNEAPAYDTARIRYLQKLRVSKLEFDFTEPINRDFLKRLSDSLFEYGTTAGNDRILGVSLENDLFNNTDRYFTNGINFQYVGPALRQNPVRHLLLPYWTQAVNYYGLSLVQNMYTPSTTKIGGIHYGDRPYAAYLYIGSFKITNDLRHHVRQTSELDLGVIGKESGGAAVQDIFHKYIPYNNEPLGWENQIATDAVINYRFGLEKGLLNLKYMQFIVAGAGSLGTLYTNIGGGLHMRAGWFNDYFSDLGLRKRKVQERTGARVWQYYFTLKGNWKLVGYDATLQGGLLNKNNVYTVDRISMSTVVTQTSLGFTLTWGGLGLEIEELILSPEFSNNQWHSWGRIGLSFAL
jgi:hypothetical protein